MARLLTPLLLAPSLAGCDIAGCDNQVLQAVVAPGGRHTAFVYRRDCGATTGFSTQVSVEKGAASFPAEPGTVLVLGDEPAFLTWLGPDRLQITHRRGARPAFQEERQDGVQISYRSL